MGVLICISLHAAHLEEATAQTLTQTLVIQGNTAPLVSFDWIYMELSSH